MMARTRQLPRLLLAFTLIVLGACSREDASPAADEPSADDAAPATLVLPQAAPSARLPDSIAPTRYRLHLKIDPRQERFSGETEIDITLAGSTSFLWLHGLDLTVESARAELADGTSIALEWTQALATGTARLDAHTPLPAGNATLHFTYSAPFNTALDGLYSVAKGDSSYAFTQFEATAARLAFPSFDEPAFKVPFDIQLTVPADQVGVTNTPLVSEEPAEEGFKTLRFATTKPLPTYLVAFAVGPFDVVEWEAIPANDLRDTPLALRGFTTAGKGDEIHYALANTAAIVDAMEYYFDTPYPYAKLDIIAVPDFAAGAMENAGAITYREQLILLDEDASVSQKRGFFITHAHELAHQWFGNLVTPLWWDDIWLNEAFATWNSHIILDQLYPEQNYRESLQSSAAGVMRSDSLASARQIREPIERHEDIGSAFNGITYRKGGGVLSMFESFLGPENFRDGIRHYMKEFAFANTTAHDFIGAIADANPQVNGEDLREAFRSYIEQPGLPLLSASLACSDAGSALTLRQQRYLPVGSNGSTDERWTIPACVSIYSDGKPQSQCFLLNKASETVMLNTEHCPDAVLPNTGGRSYYRWSLPAVQWQALLARIDELDSSEQISVANSLSAALNAGTIALPDYLQAVAPITASQSWRVAIAPRTDLYKIKEFVANDAERTALEARLRGWYQPGLDTLNSLESLTPDQQQFRMLLMSTLALGAHDPVVREELLAAGAAYTGYGGDQQLDGSAIDPNLRFIALLVSVEEHGRDFTDLLWKHFQTSDNALEKQLLLGAMAHSTNPEVAAEVRELILSPKLKDNEIFYIYANQMGRTANRDPLWQWTVANMDAVLERIPAWRKGQLPSLFSNFCDLAHARQMEEVFAPVIDTLESGPRTLANSVETIHLCAAFVEQYRRPDAP